MLLEPIQDDLSSDSKFPTYVTLTKHCEHYVQQFTGWTTPWEVFYARIEESQPEGKIGGKNPTHIPACKHSYSSLKREGNETWVYKNNCLLITNKQLEVKKLGNPLKRNLLA